MTSKKRLPYRRKTWFIRTPEDSFPVLTLYFVYARGNGGERGKIVLEAVHADEHRTNLARTSSWHPARSKRSSWRIQSSSQS